MTDGQWDSLMIPIGLAFFVESSRENGFSRSIRARPDQPNRCSRWRPGGISSQENPVLNEMESDVEALLVNRLDRAAEYYLAPIDECYQLVGLIRVELARPLRRRGNVGEIGGFFAELKAGCPMPDLDFRVESAESVPFAAAPPISLKLHVRI